MNTETSPFNNLMRIYLQNILDDKFRNEYPEFEIRFNGNINADFTSNKYIPLSKTDFNNVSNVLYGEQYKPIIVGGNYLLRIYFSYKGARSPFRCEISGLHDIQLYCKTNKWDDCKSVKFVRKLSVPHKGRDLEDIKINEYNLKVSYKSEEVITGESIFKEPLLTEFVNNWENTDKTFRYMNRVTFMKGPTDTVMIDMSIVKSSSQNKDGSFIPVNDIHGSNVFNNPEKYEIEIELNNDNIKTNIRSLSYAKYTSNIITYVREVITHILKGLQRTTIPISKKEMEDVLFDYYVTVYDQSKSISNIRELINKVLRNKSAVDPYFFMGPSSKSLQFENLQEETEEDPYKSIIQNYAVTDKADGERCIMFISNVRNSGIYLIDMSMHVRYTGCSCEMKYSHLLKNTNCQGSIIDGEYVTHDKHGNIINTFLAFDFYVYNYSLSIRKLPFMKNLKNEKINQYRHHLLGELFNYMKVINNVSKDSTKTPFRTELKTFLQPTYAVMESYVDRHKFGNIKPQLTSIFQENSSIMFSDTIYNKDGLIFTNLDLPVGAHSLKEYGPLNKIRWNYSFKWKPSYYNTIDFLVTQTYNTKIMNLVTTGVDNVDLNPIIQYKQLELRCGLNIKKHGFIDAFKTTLLESNIISLLKYTNSDSSNNPYIPTLFHPTNYPDETSYICNVVLKKDQGGIPQMFTEEHDILEPNTIVEFRYDVNNSPGFRWIPLRVRYDKTSDYLHGFKSYGNDYDTANNVWSSIHNPITDEIITTGKDIPTDNTLNNTQDAYYNRNNIGNRDILQRFHNYIKHKLIESVLLPNDTLIDLACGRGGDLHKWSSCKASLVFGIDLYPDNIENRFDGACARYLNLRVSDTRCNMRCIFVSGDTSKNIQDGSAYTIDKYKDVSYAMFGNKLCKDERIIGDLYGIGKHQFNVASCQFALHYFFKDIQTLSGFMSNVSQNVKIDGYFIATCFDGTKLFDKIQQNKPTKELVIMSTNDPTDVYWKCTPLFTQTTFPNDSGSLGYPIDIYQKSIGKNHTEYLVNTIYFIQVMENYGFEAVHITPFQNIYNNLSGNELTTYEGISKLNEKEISFLNVQMVFKKKINIEYNKVVLDDMQFLEKDKTSNIQPKPKILKNRKNIAKPPQPVPEAEPDKKPRKRIICKENQEFVEATQSCLKKCDESTQVRNPTTQRCVKKINLKQNQPEPPPPDEAPAPEPEQAVPEPENDKKPRKRRIKCKDNQEFVEATQSCLKKCDEATQVRNPTTQRCVKKINLKQPPEAPEP